MHKNNIKKVIQRKVRKAFQGEGSRHLGNFKKLTNITMKPGEMAICYFSKMFA